MNQVNLKTVLDAAKTLEGVVKHTPLEKVDEPLGNVYLKREDKQKTRAFKFRGAYNFMSRLDADKRVVCASTGNHAQGVALSCNLLGINGEIYVPECTPDVKKQRTEDLGNGYVKVISKGSSFDEALKIAQSRVNGNVFVHPFDNPIVISGQGTIGLEILDDLDKVDYIFVAIGGGGLISGISSYIRAVSPSTRMIGVEPTGADAMCRSLEAGKLVNLDYLDKFVDGVAVKKVCNRTLKIAEDKVDDIVLVENRTVADRVLDFYKKGEIVEPAGALSLAGYDKYTAMHGNALVGKNVVCIISGGNLDVSKIENIEGIASQYALR